MSENAAALGRTQSAAQNYHHAQLKLFAVYLLR